MLIQYGIIAWRRDAEGELRILLITSRERGRWVIPRGNPIAGLSPPLSAAREALEEAGVEGEVGAVPIGSYRYRKHLRFGMSRAAEVTLYPMKVERIHDKWDEAHQRTRAWFAPHEAAEAVDEPELKALIRGFAPDAALSTPPR